MKHKQYVVAYAANQHADMLSGLARKLRDDHNIGMIIVCGSVHELPNPTHYKWDSDAFSEIIDLESHIRPRPASELPSAGDLAGRAAVAEQSLSVPILDLIRTDRHVGRGFIVGAQTMRSIYSESTSYPAATDIVIRLTDVFRALLDKYAPIAVIAPFAPFYAATLVAVAEQAQIPVTWPLFSRAGKQLYWTADRFNWPLGMAEAYEITLRKLQQTTDDDNDDGVSQAHLDAPHAMRILNERNRKAVTFNNLIKTLYQQTRRSIGDRTKRRDRIYGKYFMRDRLWFALERWAWRRRALKIAPVEPQIEQGLPFVFFPLHLEPEVALMSEASKADNQMAIIDWLCKTVPTGWYVVIKEHPNATLPRPPGFWSRMRDYPNLVVASPYEPSDPIIDRARAVAVINGTVGVQAAIKGIPVLSYHEHFPAHLMPHVRFTDSFTGTRQFMADVANDAFPPVRERLLAGRAFRSALEVSAFELNNAGMLIGVSDGTEVAEDDLKRICENFIETVRHLRNAGAVKNIAS